ncbi:MAG TPA: 23S rRNA (cytosine(1962)-C(5))-methyltransferase RlmI [Chloroflexi bacterium]|nr:23S rRNA (cytosine(1962)-C(5))-methyltransferase RlmI [Chloroflexota bacterium]HBY07933.1 23S rRNA (cytosine(1962)-C(5))-methyltransferase RlmI [Chloroflexota bacterium]
MNVIYLKSGREKSLLRRHPWVFSGAIAKEDGNPEIGGTVEVRDSHGRFLAWGAYSPESQIRVRVWSWDPQDIIGPEFFHQRILQAIARRTMLRNRRPLTTDREKTAIRDPRAAIRLIFAESDELPGLIVDQYADTLVMQCLSAGAERWRQSFVEILLKLTRASYIFERSDADVRLLEGLPERIGPLWGDPPEQVVITENGLRFVVNLAKGHKTGFYLDQRVNRLRLQELAAGQDVLDCFTYTGGFTINALAGGAKSVTSVDASEDALLLAQENVKLNGLPLDRVEWLQTDVFQQLRKFRDQGRNFDLIVLDPPKFAPTASQAQKAARGYKDINLLALKLLRPGGTLLTFSCSGGVDAALFQKIIAGAALDAGISTYIVNHLEQSPDHPVALNFPEGAYLKGLILRIG